MKLHYSQTQLRALRVHLTVSVPYEITLLSNFHCKYTFFYSVSVPYEITLLSNHILGVSVPLTVSVPYEITLLSN